MARKRLSWDESRLAELVKKADPYTMNQDRKNPPAEKYMTGDPNTWAETPNMDQPWDSEGRVETGHPAMKEAQQAITAARKLEAKAINAITIAQRMLPGSSDEVIEGQAADLMYMPEKAIMSTLQRQSELAEAIAAKSEEEDEDDKKQVEAKKEEKVEEKVEEKLVEAKKEEKVEEKVEEKPVEDKKEEKVEEKVEEKPVEAKKEEKKEDVVEASDEDVLDKIFASELIIETEKAGAKKLSGLVQKEASQGANNLSDLWETPPDISQLFK